MINDKKIHRKVSCAIYQLNRTGSLKQTKSDYCRHYMRVIMPYFVRSDGIVLNREYKPLGVGNDGNDVDYEDYPESFITLESAIKTAELLPKRGNISEVFFYNDENPPWASARSFKEYLKLINQWLNFLHK